MSNTPKSLNDAAWEKLFEKYGILAQIDAQGMFSISAAQIKEFREPRLMAKFDHTINLPKIFADNQLAILPVTRGDYVVAHFDAYHKFEVFDVPVTRVSLPKYLQSLDASHITSEAIALNCAVASGIVADFLQDEDMIATVSGRMGSGTFSFNITNSKSPNAYTVPVSNSQLEIDAAYEGKKGLTLMEAKCDLSEDFLIRQLYYPFRAWQHRMAKPVNTVFLIYSNGIYRLYAYTFQDANHYNSLVLVNRRNYTIEDITVGIADIQDVLRQTREVPEPEIPFPQADNFERVINICELLNEQTLNRNEVTEEYAFDARQTNYYTDAARYLGLLEKKKDGVTPVYSLSEEGKRILNVGLKQRQLAYCNLILSHKIFNETLREYFEKGNMPPNDEIVNLMRNANLYHVGSDSTYARRSSTIKGWLNWIIGLTNYN